MRRLLTVLALLALAPPVWADPPAAKLSLDRKDLHGDLEKIVEEGKLPALGAAVVTSEGLLVAEVVGIRRRGYKPAATTADHFHLGSDTKALTAMLAAVLVQQKKLAYDLTLAKAFPELQTSMNKAFRDVTLEQLLTHCAGLPNNLDNWRAIPLRLPIRQQRLMAVQKALSGKPAHEPGSKYHYSNLGYVIVAAIMEKTMNAPWEDLVRKHVAAPLGMTSLGFGPPGRAAKIDQPWGHDPRGRSVEPGLTADDPPVLGPATRIHCSLSDWAKFIADQLKGAKGKDGLLPAAAYKKLHTPAGKEVNYSAGGWLVETLPGVGDVLNHDGSNGGFYVHAVVILPKEVAVLVVANQGGETATKACHIIRQAILARLFKP